LADAFVDFLVRRPDVFQIHRFAFFSVAERFTGDVDCGRAGQRIGHDQRRGGEIVAFGERMDATFEVPVA